MNTWILLNWEKKFKLSSTYREEGIGKKKTTIKSTIDNHMFKLLEYLNIENTEILRAFGKFIFNVFNGYYKISFKIIFVLLLFCAYKVILWYMQLF